MIDRVDRQCNGLRALVRVNGLPAKPHWHTHEYTDLLFPPLAEKLSQTEVVLRRLKTQDSKWTTKDGVASYISHSKRTDDFFTRAFHEDLLDCYKYASTMDTHSGTHAHY